MCKNNFFNYKRLGLYDYCWVFLFCILIISNFLNQRFFFEFCAIFISFFALKRLFKFIFIFIFLIFSVVDIDSLYANASLVYYILAMDLISRRNHEKVFLKISFFILLSIIVVVYFAIVDLMSGAPRPVSLFSSPLSLGYYLSASAIVLYFNNKTFFYFSFILPMISGSRSAFVIMLSLIKNNSFFYKMIIFFILMYIVYLLFLSDIFFSVFQRSFSFHSVSDGVRFDSWGLFLGLDWSFKSIVFGFGRHNFGSLGYYLGNVNSIVIESSLLSLIASYGLLFGAFWIIFMIFYMIKLRSFSWFIYMVVGSVSVFMDSLGVMLFILFAFSYFDNRRAINAKD